MKKNFLTIVAPLLFIMPLAQVFPNISCTPTRDGGVFRSSDRGETFAQKVAITKNQTIAGVNILTVKNDPQDSKIIYLGTRGEGLYKSMDGGDTWYRLNETDKAFTKRANVYDIAIDPQNSSNIYVGTYQDRFGRLFRSPDGGKNWEEVYRVSREKYAIFAVEVDIYDPAIVYMGSAEGGLFKSTDFGKSWKTINWFDDVISDIEVNPLDTRIVYVSTFNKGIYKTTDKGQSWQKLESLASFREAEQVEQLVMDNKNPNTLYTGSQYGLLKSTDGGQTWQVLKIVIPPQTVSIQAVALDPVSSSNIYYSAGNVLYRSQDSGQTWTLHPIVTTKNIKVITIDSQNPNVIYLGMQQ